MSFLFCVVHKSRHKILLHYHCSVFCLKSELDTCKCALKKDSRTLIDMVLSNCTFSNGMPKNIGDVLELLEPWFESASGEAQPSSVTISLLDRSFGKVCGLLQVSENKSLI